MKELVGKILAKLHVIIMVYAAFSFYEAYSTHDTLLSEITSQIPEVEEEIQKSEKKLSQIDEFRKNVDQTKLKVAEVFNSIEKVQRQLPSDINDIEVLDYLTKEGRGLNMPEIEPNPMNEEASGFYISKPYRIKAKGTFLQFVIFLERINAAERLFNVKNLTMRSDNTNQKGRFQVVSLDATIDTFKYNQSHKESSGIEEIEKQFSGPGGGGKKKKKKGGSNE